MGRWSQFLGTYYGRVSGKAAFYNMTQWHAAADKSLRYEDFAGEDYYLGLDLAQRLDLNAGVGVFVREIEGKKHYYCIRPKFWVPEDTVRSTDPKIAKTADRYVKFVEMGALEATDGAEPGKPSDTHSSGLHSEENVFFVLRWLVLVISGGLHHGQYHKGQ